MTPVVHPGEPDDALAQAQKTRRPLWPSRWPAEDGGGRREQVPAQPVRGLAIQSGERLELAALRDAYATTMVVLRDPGEMFVLRHTIGTRPRRDPSTCWVERIDPLTLAPLARSPMLPGGPFWPGGLLAHGRGWLHVVHGRHCHRLSPELGLLASAELPRRRPYNSAVALVDGTLAMKDLDLTLREPARISLLDPDTLAPRVAEVKLPEASIARVSADENTLYVVGVSTVWRYHWDGTHLRRDLDWQVPYNRSGYGYGWDPVIAGGHLWFLDNGAHDYSTTMRGAGRATGPVHLIRVSLAAAADRTRVEVSGLPRGTVTNPPLYDARRRIAIAYDSGNGIVQAFRFGKQRDRKLEPLWRRQLAHAAHMLLYPDTGALVLGDFHGPAIGRTSVARRIGRRSARPAKSATLRRALARSSGDDVVIVDVETGDEHARVRMPSMFQSVLFPAPGFGRDLYWCTFSTLARLEVIPGQS
jgi:hypothetical protein